MYSPISYLRFWVALSLLMLLFLTISAHATQVPGPLVETDWLADNLDNVVILDVRISPVSFEKKRRSAGAVNPCGVSAKKKTPMIVSGHIPGAVLVPYKDVNKKQKINDMEIKGLVLDKSAFEKLMQKSGVHNDSGVVIAVRGQNYKDVYLATRLYWMMKYYGHDNVALLNGGTKKWIKEGRKVKYGKSRPKKSSYKAADPRRELIATADDVTKAINDDNIQLVDNRGLEDYLGLTYHRKFTNPNRKGHIPGSKFWPYTTLVDTKGTPVFYTTNDMRKVAELMKVDLNKPTITYCWSGGFSSTNWFVIHEMLGNKEARVYDGSMHAWTQDQNNPLVSMKIE